MLVSKSRTLRGILVCVVALSTLLAAAGSLGSLPRGRMAEVYPPAYPPGLSPAPAGSGARATLSPAERDPVATSDDLVGVARSRTAATSPRTSLVSSASSGLTMSAGGSPVSTYDPPAPVVQDLVALTGLKSSTVAKLCGLAGDWRPVVRKAAIYRLITERLPGLGSDARTVTDVIESGAEPFEVLSVLECLLSEGLPVSELPGILACRATGASWASILDPIRVRFGKAEADPLTKDEIRAYFARGLSPQDILEGVGLGQTTGRPSRSFLEGRLSGKTWEQLALACDPRGLWAAKKSSGVDEECQSLLKLGYRLADIKLAQPYARAMGLDTEAVLRQTTAGLSIEQVAANRAAEMEAAQQKIILERLKATYGVDQDVLDRWRGLGLNAHEIDNVLRLAKARGLDPETIAGERLAGTSWESILERHAPAGTGGA